MQKGRIAHLLTSARELCQGICAALESQSVSCITWSSLQSFEEDATITLESCLLLDSQATGAEGLGPVVQRIASRLSVIVICDAGDVRATADPMKNGATDVVERTSCLETFATKVCEAIAANAGRVNDTVARRHLCVRVEMLTERERMLATMLSIGMSNKEIAAKLKISVNTVANHRASIHCKLQTQSTAELVRTMVASSCPHLLQPHTRTASGLPLCLCTSADGPKSA